MVPDFFGKKNENGIPTVAIIASCLVTIPIALSGTFAQLAMLSVVARFLQYIPTCLSVLVFRKRFSDAKGTFKAPFGPVLPIAAVAICLYLLADQPMAKIAVGIGFIIIISPLYLMAQKKVKQAQKADA